jgi:hypothetical protein
MTLLLTEIHCLDGLSHSCILFAADRRISRNGKYDGTQRKVFQIPYLQAGVGFFGLAEVPTGGNILSMSAWLSRFIRKNSRVKSLEIFASMLRDTLNSDIDLRWRQKHISGFHVAGYNSVGIPEFWYIRNVKDDRTTITGRYEAREDFLHRDACNLGYDGQNPHSARTGQSQTYRNGDIRAHVTAWEKIDGGFGSLFKEPEFKRPLTSSDLEQWAKFKMEVITYFYKKYCRQSIVARPIDTFLIEGKSA